MKKLLIGVGIVSLFLLMGCMVSFSSGGPSPEEDYDETIEDETVEQPVSCTANSDCVPASCCHADTCIPVSDGPPCKGTFCTQECAPGTIDCGGGCQCVNGECQAYYAS